MDSSSFANIPLMADSVEKVDGKYFRRFFTTKA
jgi:hypothetical protein